MEPFVFAGLGVTQLHIDRKLHLVWNIRNTSIKELNVGPHQSEQEQGTQFSQYKERRERKLSVKFFQLRTFAIFLEWLSLLLLVEVKRSTGSGSITTSWNGYIVPIVWHALCQWFDSFTAKDNDPCSDKEDNPIIAIINLISSYRPTD